MKKALLGLLVLCGYSICSVGQVGLYLTAGTDVSIQTGTVFSVDGLVLTPSSAFTINSPNSLTRNVSFVNTIPYTYIHRVYHFGNISNSYNGNVEFYYADSERNGIAETALTLYTHSGTVGQFFAPVSRDATNNIVTTNNLPGITLNEITLADMLTPLPLVWGPIQAQRKQNAAVINWETENESAIAYFQVESSVDAIHWSITGSKVAAANIPGNHRYEVTDGAISPAQTFYRIKQVGLNGQFNYSAVAVVQALATSNEIIVYPNPTTSWLRIQAASQSITSIKLYDASGRRLRYESVKVNRYTLNLSDLPKGTYRVEVLLNNGNKQQHQVLKQ